MFGANFVKGDVISEPDGMLGASQLLHRTIHVSHLLFATKRYIFHDSLLLL